MRQGCAADEGRLTGADGVAVDLDNCAKEPIHIPGAIQPHGALLALSEPDLTIRHASANAGDLLSHTQPLPGTRLAALLPDNALGELRARLSTEQLSTVNPIRLQLPNGPFNVIAHRTQGLLILEFEPVVDLDPAFFFHVHQGVNAALEAIASAPDLASLWERTAQQVKALTGYHRVMIYRFDADYNGQVIAEAREPRQEPFLGLHYPASDIPAQARELYRRNWLRIIPDVSYTPVPLLAEAGAAPSLDLSASVLRSVSPMHLQYLRNMGVTASMSVSVIRDGELWGLIACHHDRPAPLPYETRQGLELIGKFFSSQIGAREKEENRGYRQALRDSLQQLLAQMRRETEFLDGLHRYPVSLLNLANGCVGAGIHHRGRTTLIGTAPPVDAIRELAAWLPTHIGPNGVFATASLAALYPPAAAWKACASGLLCVSIPEPEPSYILWFKPEVLQTVNWGGNPDKAMEAGKAGELSPRRSFALWQETVRMRALPWVPEELEAVEVLRQAIIELDLQRQVAAAMASNEELDHFAHVVAHDLKEPLRGITAFTAFLVEDLDDRLDPESRANLGEIHSLAEQARGMVRDLYEYSRVGQVDLAFEETDLNEVVASVKERLSAFLRETNASISLAKPLPRLRCDRSRIAEVFANLVSNALKYNDNPDKHIEIGVDERQQPPRFFVRDNGIGIDPSQHQRVFRLFERLHAPGRYGEGSGSGLPIVRRIVERHGGQIWLESSPGEGSTFHFTLSPQGEMGAVPVLPGAGH